MPTSATETSYALLELAGSADGELVQSTGYYSADDGGALTYRWDAASTATPDGVDATHPGLIYKPTAVGGAGRWIAQVPHGVINAKWFGVKADNVQDDTPYIQAAIDRAINIAGTWPWGAYRVTLPAGNIKTTGTIHLGYGNSAFSMVSLESETLGPSYFTWGTRLRPTFTDKPVINIQGGRNVVVRGIGIIGTLAAPTYATTNLPHNESAWDAIVPTYPNQQFAGITIDAFSGAQPAAAERYTPPVGWSMYHSSNVRIEGCHFEACGVGVLTKPSGGSGADNNGDYVSCDYCTFETLKYGFAPNGSQSRGNRARHCNFVNCFAAMGLGWFGPGLGRDAFIESCALEGCGWMVEGTSTDWVGQIVIDKCFGERCSGIVNVSDSSGKANIAIRDNLFVMFDGNDAGCEIRQHVICPKSRLTFSGNNIHNEGTTRPTIIIRCGVNSVVQNNTIIRSGATYGAPGLVVIPGDAYGGQVGLSVLNNGSGNNRVPNPSTPYATALLASATYSGAKQFTGSSSIGTISDGAVGDIITHVTAADQHGSLFKIIQLTPSIIIEQITDCDGTDPVSSADTITRLAADRLSWRLTPVEYVLKAARGL